MKHLRTIVEGDKRLEGVKSSSTVDAVGDFCPDTGKDRNLVKKHKIEKHADRVGNGDDVYKGKTKKNTLGKPAPAYEAVEELGEISKNLANSYIQKAHTTESMDLKKWEKTPMDKVVDKAAGYKEGSKADNKADKKALKAFKKTEKMDCKEEINEAMFIAKGHVVDHDLDSKEFAKHYVAAKKGDHREGEPIEKDHKAIDYFYSTYSDHHVRSGFAGSRTTHYTNRKTGERYAVDRYPNGKGFHGTNHSITKLKPLQHLAHTNESVELDEISKKLAGNFIIKADTSLRRDGDSMSQQKRFNRVKNIKTASKKFHGQRGVKVHATEEIEPVHELFSKGKISDIRKAASDKIKAVPTEKGGNYTPKNAEGYRGHFQDIHRADNLKNLSKEREFHKKNPSPTSSGIIKKLTKDTLERNRIHRENKKYSLEKYNG